MTRSEVNLVRLRRRRSVCRIRCWRIREFAREHRKFSFRNLLERQCSKVQVIVTFLSILELMKMGHIHVQQEELFDDISIEVQTDPESWKNLTEFAEEG